MKRPLLKDGATIGIVAPSSAQPFERIERGVQKLEQMGYHVVLMPSCTSSSDLKLSGPDEIRANDINTLFERDDIDAIICSSGGYGSPRIVDQLDYEMIKKHPKPFVGFSDITLFLNAITKECDFITYHGPMIVGDFSNNKGDTSIESFLQLATNNGPLIINEDDAFDITVIKEGIATGELVGGNLSLLQVLVSSEYLFDPVGKILLIEDVHEANYRIDRMLQSLRLRGVFNGLKGVIIGGITGETTPQEGSLEVFQAFFQDAPYPVLFNAPIGHVIPRYTVLIGGLTEINTDSKTITVY